MGLSHGIEASTPPISQDVINMLKKMKPLVYRGEERDRNKDAIYTFLLKWTDLHDLQHTPDFIHALEASLSLEGKTYKWWMSLDVRAHPGTWDRF